MKCRCLIPLILTLSIPVVSLAQREQAPNERHGAGFQGNTQVPTEELKQAQELADRFIKRFRETRDLTPMVGEMFAFSDFERLIGRDVSWGGLVGVGRLVTDQLNPEERQRCFVMAFSLHYLIRLYMAGKLPWDSEVQLRKVWPAHVEKFFKDNEPSQGLIKTAQQARNYVSFLESALAVMQKEVAKDPPEETEQFQKNLVSFEKHLREYEQEQPAVWISDRDKHGRVAGTLFARFMIPFHVGLVMVKDKGLYRIWLARTHLPPD